VPQPPHPSPIDIPNIGKQTDSISDIKLSDLLSAPIFQNMSNKGVRRAGVVEKELMEVRNDFQADFAHDLRIEDGRG